MPLARDIVARAAGSSLANHSAAFKTNAAPNGDNSAPYGCAGGRSSAFTSHVFGGCTSQTMRLPTIETLVGR